MSNVYYQPMAGMSLCRMLGAVLCLVLALGRACALTEPGPEFAKNPYYYVAQAQIDEQQNKNTEAVENWKRALELFEARKDLKGEASTHLALAELLTSSKMPTPDEARTHAEEAIVLYTKLNDTEGEAKANLSLARWFAKKQDAAKSRSYLETALKLAHESKNSALEVNVLSDMCLAYATAGNPADAAMCYHKAAAMYETLGGTGPEANALNGEAEALNQLHRPEDALATALKSVRLADISGAASARYWERRLLSTLYAERGDYEGALKTDREARTIADQAKNPLEAAWAALDESFDLTTLGYWQQALDDINFALPIFQQSNDAEIQLAAYSQLINIYGARESEMQDFNKAGDAYQSAIRLAEKIDPERIPSLGLDIEEVYWQQGRLQEAVTKASEALRQYKKAKDEWGEASALLALAEAQRLSGDVRAAAKNLGTAQPLVEHTHDFYLSGQLYYVQAGLLKQEGRFKEAIAQYEKVIDLLEQVKSSSHTDLQRRASETYDFIYDELIDCYYQLGSGDKSSPAVSADSALKYAELNKSRIFTNTWGRTFLDVLRRQLPAELQEKERSLTARRQALQDELEQVMSGEGTRSVKQVQEDLTKLGEEQSALEKELRRVSPAYAGARYPTPVSIAKLPLRNGEAFVEFKMLDDALLVWLIEGTANGPQLVAFNKVEHPRKWFEERILDIRSAFNRGHPDQFDPQTSEELFQALFPPTVAQPLLAARSIVFVPDSVLFLIPFEILSPKASQSQFVFLKTPTTYFPSAAAFRLSRAVKPSNAKWQSQFFGIADPITSTDDDRYVAARSISGTQEAKSPALEQASFPARGGPTMGDLNTRGYFFSRLPGTLVEIESIAKLFPADSNATMVRTGVQATKRELLQTDLGRFRYVHFATHGFLPVESGLREPALILSYDGEDEGQMMLSLSEVLQLKLHADMVVLSACNTGSGTVTRAEGVASLGTAFLAAGASSTTMSLWKVNDNSTAILMQEFYQNLLKGMPKNEALAAARSTLVSKGYSNPFLWAPFILTGE